MKINDLSRRHEDTELGVPRTEWHFSSQRRRKVLSALVGLLVLLPTGSLFAGDKLGEKFANPPEATRPWCYWYWLRDHISCEGISKDLDAMAHAGISTAIIGNVNHGPSPAGPVKIFSPEWYTAVRHTLSEAERLGVDIYMFNSPGWSQSGGPWVKPEQSMRRVIWNEINAQGGPFSAKVRNAPQDIAVLAIPRKQWEGEAPAEPTSNPNLMRLTRAEPWNARSLAVFLNSGSSSLSGALYELDASGKRTLVAKIKAGPSNTATDFLPLSAWTYSFKEARAKVFELECEVSNGVRQVVLSSRPVVASAVEKQLGRLHPTPSPTWESYIFPDTQEPSDPSLLVRQGEVLNLSGKLDADGVLSCQLPPGEWTILYFGMITTGKTNKPATREGTGLECDKMSREHLQSHLDGMFGKLLGELTPKERKAFKGIIIDSYEVASQNWTDGFAEIFKQRNGYDPIALLPVLAGHVIESAKTSDTFLWDLRRTVADLISENYVGGMTDYAREKGMRMWCENYGHWGFPGDFTMYGGYADQIGGEFWAGGKIGTVECRAASSAGHTYGKNIIHSEAFTSGLILGVQPRALKSRGEEMFCEGINHFVLHLYSHQPSDGVPGINPPFGVNFHRNTPWFGFSRNWNRYLQRCSFMLQQGEPVADTAVYIGDFAPQMTGPKDPVPAGYDYDYVGSDALLRTVKVENGEFVVRDESDPSRIAVRYKMIAMPEYASRQMRPKVRSRLEELKKAGGVFVDGVPVSTESLAKMNVVPLVSKTANSIRWKARRLEQGGMLFFLTGLPANRPVEVTLRVKEKAPELFDPVTGENRRLARFWADGEGTRVVVQSANGSAYIVCRDKPNGPSVVGVQRDGKPDSGADIELFYDAKSKLMAGSRSAGKYTLSMSDGTTRSCSFEPAIQPAVITGPWNKLDEKAGGSIVAQETSFQLPAGFDQSQWTVLDLGKVNGMAKVTLNGQEFETLWTPPFELDVTKALKTGENRLKVEAASPSTAKASFGPEVYLRPVSTKEIN